jgi:hypothetical protein
MAHTKAHWNIEFHRRANLALLPKEYHLANDPWFILTRENTIDVMNFVVNEHKLCNTVCNGGLANESLFAIIFTHYKKIQNVINKTTHMADWFRVSSPTSPHLFKEGNEEDIQFIEDFLANNDFAMFIRKVHPDFPDEILRRYICESNHTNNTNTYININSCFHFCIGIFIGVSFISFFILYNISNLLYK